MSDRRQNKFNIVTIRRNSLYGLRCALRRVKRKNDSKLEFRINDNKNKAVRFRVISSVCRKILTAISLEACRDIIRAKTGQVRAIEGLCGTEILIADQAKYRSGRIRSGSVRAEKEHRHTYDIGESFLGHRYAERYRPDIHSQKYKGIRAGVNQSDSVIYQSFSGIAKTGSEFGKFLYRGTGLYHLEHRRKLCCYRPEQCRQSMRVCA